MSGREREGDRNRERKRGGEVDGNRRVVHVEEVFYHCFGFGRVFAFGGAVECHASVGIGAAGDEMVEQGDVAGCGYVVEVL